MTLSQFIAEIENDLSTYAESNDIDRISIKMWVIDCLRELGVNICELSEDIFLVENSKAILPEYFKSLKLALLLDTVGCDKKCPQDKIPYAYRQRIENPAYYDIISGEYITSCHSKIITEKIYIENEAFSFYHNYRWLSLVKGINKKSISPDCLNLSPRIRNNYPDQINVSGNTINTNFPSGQIYAQFYSLPMEDEEVAIPEITVGAIKKYIAIQVKANIAEYLIANNKNPQGLSQLYPMWIQQLPILKRGALAEAKFSGLSKDWNKKYKARVKRDNSIFNLPQIKF